LLSLQDQNSEAVGSWKNNEQIDDDGGVEVQCVVSLIGGVGYYDADLTVSATARDGVRSISDSAEDSESGASLIGAVQLEFERISLRGEYEWFDAEDSVEAWDVALGLVFRF
jgi:hypothetical protein